VLVVDDSRFVRASLVRGLAPRFRLQQAESGERAWELLLLDPSIGAVLSDLSMPGMDGFELLRRVRGSMLERVRSLPFVVLSGADDPVQRDRAEALGADRFSVKGDDVDALADWIAARLAAPTTPAPEPAAAHAAAPDAASTDACGPPGDADVASTAPQAPDAAAGVPMPDEATAPEVTAPGATAAEVAAAEPAATEATATEATATAAVATDAAATDAAATDAAATDAAATDAAATEPAPTEPAPTEAAPTEAAPTEAAPTEAAPTEAAPTAAAAHGVPDPLVRWFDSAAERPLSPGDAPFVLIRLHAPGLAELPARLRRGVRSADALHVDGADTAWLCVPASAALAVRLSLRFGLLAAGRFALAPGTAGARVEVSVRSVDPARPADALAALRASPPQPPLPGAMAGLQLRSLAGPAGPAWQCVLPWPAVRLLVA